MKNLLLAIAIIFLTVNQASALEIGVGKGQIVNLPKPAAHVFIADPAIADIDVRSPNYIYVYGLTVGETTLHALDSNNRPIVQMDIIVERNMANVARIVKEVMPDADIHFSSADNGIIMQGEVDTPEDSQKAVNIVNAALGNNGTLVNMLKVRGSDQVMLRVRVAEVARTELKNFGINLSTIMTKGTFSFGLFNGRNFGGSFPGTRSGNNIALEGSPGLFDITSVIDALETQGLVKTLAEPNLTAKSGETANFLAGGEYPIPVPQRDGVVTIEYREFGVSLDFTPTVLSNDKISLRVAPEVSSLATSTVTINDNVIPSLSIRRASTTVELGSGESFVIGGLMRSDSTNDINKFPWLGDIPILGALFRSNNFQNNETELVIIATPYIVRGVKESDKLLTPTDGFEVPNDFDRIVMGKTEVEKAEPGRAATGPKEGVIAKYKLNGDAGYLLED